MGRRFRWRLTFTRSIISLSQKERVKKKKNPVKKATLIHLTHSPVAAFLAACSTSNPKRKGRAKAPRRQQSGFSSVESSQKVAEKKTTTTPLQHTRLIRSLDS
jgi:hypothetical protein